jgi:hypothetical protein
MSTTSRGAGCTAPGAQTEKQFQEAVLEYAKLCGWRTYHPFDSRRSTHGYPDLTLVRDGTLIFAELKTETGRLSAAQCDWLEDLAAVSHGAAPWVIVRTWRPADWPEIERLLAR